MILFPAIDLKDGLAVRLEQGDMARATVFNRDPAAQAHIFETQGFKHLHVVDLDGAFADCRHGLDAVPGLVEALEETVRGKGRPFLGICVGMQLMAERGREYVVTEGLGWVRGEVDKIAPSDPALKIPHMGWNTLAARTRHKLLDGIPLGPDGLHAYFVHSYQLRPADSADLVAQADYGGPITAIVGRDSMAGTQFHPEKSQKLGLALIANFLKWKP